MKFFVDENLGLQIAKGMAGFGEPVIHHFDCEDLGQGVEDTVMLDYIGTKGWFLLTRDKRISKRPAEKQALKRYRVGAFFLIGKNLTRCEYIQQVVRSWPKVKQLAGETTRPFAFKIYRKGTKFKRISL